MWPLLTPLFSLVTRARYARSKLAQVVHTRELQRREPHVTVASCHPGNVQTEVSRNFPPPLHHLYAALQPLMRCAQAGPDISCGLW